MKRLKKIDDELLKAQVSGPGKWAMSKATGSETRSDR
jgi:hypothetical protein